MVVLSGPRLLLAEKATVCALVSLSAMNMVAPGPVAYDPAANSKRTVSVPSKVVSLVITSGRSTLVAPMGMLMLPLGPV